MCIRDRLSIIDCIRQAGEDEMANLQRLPADPLLDKVFDSYQQAADEHLKQTSLRDIVVADD